ncbi:MAG: DUF3365 domain-containing protein [Planctomycetes bacterium]|nr:DUF3365 domain-containing protein [Planctomycetota bacterium]
MMSNRARIAVLVSVAVVTAAVAVSRHSRAEEQSKSNDPALERTRKQVLMLDDLYKTAVVFITDKYVNSDADFAAGSAAKALFGAMKKKGWHDVRLVDATGDPIMKSNLPADDFEKEAIKLLLAGKPSPEQVVEKDQKRYLRVATPVPVVLKKCVMCHPHYADVKEGQPIGALLYTLPIE